MGRCAGGRWGADGAPSGRPSAHLLPAPSPLCSAFLSRLGLWGSAIATLQLLLLERGELAGLASGRPADLGPVLALALGFALALFAMYGATARFLQR